MTDVPAHLAALPVDHLATTAYHPWLRDALARRLGHAPRVYVPDDPGGLADLGPASPPLVLMLHGDADRPATCILGEAGHRHLQHMPAYRRAVASLMDQRTLLFVGHRQLDPDLAMLLDEWQGLFPRGGPPRHWLLGSGLGRLAQRGLLDRGIEPVDLAEIGDGGLEHVLDLLARPPERATVSGAGPAVLEGRALPATSPRSRPSTAR